MREIAAVRELPEGDSRRSHTALKPGATRPAQESDTRFVVEFKLRVGTENVKVCFTLPDVANRITHPVRALVVVNGAVPEMAPAAILSVFAMVNAALVGLSVITVGVEAGTASETTQLPEIPGVRTAGEQDNDQGCTGTGAWREMAAVNFVAPRAAVTTALAEVEMAAVDAVKAAESALAGTVKVPGTVNTDGRLLDRESVTPPAGADFERVTVHEVLALEARLAPAHLRPERVTGAAGATSERVVAAAEPFNVAVIVTGWSETSAPAPAVNVAEIVLAGTLTEGGMVSRDGALLESATAVLAVGAFDRVTVQVVLALEVRLVVAHRWLERVAGAAGATREIVAAADEPFSVAVTVADWFETSVPVPAVNVAEAALADTLTEDGTVNAGEALLERATAVLVVAGFERVTVQVVLVLEARLAAAHWREETVSGDTSESVTGLDEPFSVAVTVAV